MALAARERLQRTHQFLKPATQLKGAPLLVGLIHRDLLEAVHEVGCPRQI